MVKGRMTTKLGDIVIDPEVIAQYAGFEAMECFGIVGMAAVSMKDGLVRLLKKESVTKGINVTVADNRLFLDFHVIVAYGVSVITVADNLRHNVKYKVEEYTGLTVERINVFVEGVRVID
ncbi:MAG: Asp23/Gls24 family envelope stress response protein [Lachnospiraceae bacterium]|nr:Asp23/Gls24 family envelope stress response protein [Lachnospiraceae bacterium]